MESATQLFRQRKDGFCHSESRWSAVAQMAFIWMSKEKNKDTYLNVFKSQYIKKKKNWLRADSKFAFLNWSVLESSIVEGNIKDYFLHYFPKDTDIPNMKPDIELIDKKNDETNILIIEVKTVGAKVKGNIENYKDLVEKINLKPGYTCELYYLMSYGHEDSKLHADWSVLDEYDMNILLWEDLFINMEKLKCPLRDFITPFGDMKKWNKKISEFKEG